MVKLKLEYQAELENVTDLEPAEEVFHLDLQCSSCREKHPHPVSIDKSEERPMSGSRGNANLVWKCSFCKRESSANFDANFKRPPYTADQAESHSWASVAVIECRGCEIVGWHPDRTEWRCKGSESGTPFEVSELDWTEYDEQARQGVSIMEVKTRVGRA